MLFGECIKCMFRNKTFVTVINCMDGRVQYPVNQYMQQKYNADFVDMITEPGPNKILAEAVDTTMVNSIKRRYDVSIEKHYSKVVAIVAHYDCGGNSAEKAVQILQVQEAMKLVKSWNTEIEVLGLWVDETWSVNEIN